MLTLVLSWVKRVTGLGSFAGVATILAGLVVGVGGLAAWLRDDAVRDCNAQWELEVTRRGAALRDAVAKQALQLKDAERKLTEALASAEAAKESERIALEKQRETIKSSKSCIECRIPNERIWLRRDRTSSPRSGSGAGS